MKKLLIAIITMGFAGCNQDQNKNDTKVMDFGAFTIETPQTWKQVKEKGIDSYVGRIAIDSTDTLEFDLGWYSNSLTEREPRIVERSLVRMSPPTLDTSDLIIVEDSRGIDPDNYKRNNVKWDTIDNRKCKIVYPRQSGVGTTGIYFDSLWRRGDDIDRFNLYGDNLNPENERLLLQAIKTLKFKRL